MQYRPFGSTGFQVSALGFGAMRLPQRSGTASDIDEPQAIRMIHAAIEGGVNYVDTAYVYHGERSEVVVGRALRDGYRQRVKLATKLPSWKVKGASDFDKFLGEQLKRLETERVDYYLLHCLDSSHWPRLKKVGILERAERALQDGRIGALGFSFHDAFPLFKSVVDGYSWAFCQIQYNFLDINFQAGRAGLRYAAGRGLPVVVMEPLRGGKLAEAPPPAVAAIWARAAARMSPAERALQWLWDQPEVTTVLSGMSTLKQVKENLASAARSRPHSLSESDRALYVAAKAAYDGLEPIPCTRCGYCMPCPHGVDIPRSFALYNEAIAYGDLSEARRAYLQLAAEGSEAGACEGCAECETQCPQKIEIGDWMSRVDEKLG